MPRPLLLSATNKPSSAAQQIAVQLLATAAVRSVQLRPSLEVITRWLPPVLLTTTSRPTLLVTASSLAGLRALALLGLAFQLTTLLLVLAGPVPPRPVASSTTVFRSDAGARAGEVPTVTPLSDR